LPATYGLERAEIGAGYAHERFRAGGFGSNSDDFNLNGKFRFAPSQRFAQSQRMDNGVLDAAASADVRYTRFEGTTAT